MSAMVLQIAEIIADPAIRGGRPVIAGTTLRVSDVVAYHVYGGQTVEELAVGFQLSLGKVHAALAYYHLHKSAIDEEMRANTEEAEQQLALIKAQGRVFC
jgi:uncharacterized protein (DUF433 family)